MTTRWRLDYTKLTILAVVLMLPVGVACGVRDGDWTVLGLFFTVLGLDLRIKRAHKTGSGKGEG